jgi:hypothetical protein
MAKSGAFGQRQSQPKNGGGPSSSSSKSGTFQISAKNGLQEGGDKEEDEADSNGEDERRRAAEQMADWKERHPRGWGNTYNKG